MITSSTNKDVQTSFSTAKKMTIKANGKAFKTIALALYKNIHSAILREASQNSFDSHQRAKQLKPFEISLPTVFNPVFKIQDFGVGMDESFIEDDENGYLAIFASSKEKTNTQNGGWGIGRAVFLTISDSYILTNIKNGKKSIYNIFLDADGVPSLGKISSEKTEEHSGVTIEFSVNQSDINQFSNHLTYVLKWFPISPIVKQGDKILEIPKIAKSSIYGEKWFFQEFENYYSSKPGVWSGCYFYEIDYHSIKFDDKQRALLDSGIIIEAPIGKISVNASRESISWDDKTENYIRDCLNNALIEIYEKYSKLILSAKTYLEACKIYTQLKKDTDNTQLREVFKKINFEWNGLKLTTDICITNTKKIPNPNFGQPGQPAEIIENYFEYIEYSKYSDSLSKDKQPRYFNVRKNIEIFYEDSYVSYATKRLKEYLSGDKVIWMIYCSDVAKIDEFFKINKLEGLEYKKISSLPKPVITRANTIRSEHAKNYIFEFNELNNHLSDPKQFWNILDEDEKDEGKEYYICIHSFNPTVFSNQLIQKFIVAARSLGVLGQNDKIYGVKQAQYCKKEEFQEKDFIRFLKKNISEKVFSSKIVDSETKTKIHELNELIFLPETRNEEINKFVNDLKNAIKINEEATEQENFYKIFSNYGIINFQLTKNLEKFDLDIEKIFDKAPVLRYIAYSKWKEQAILDYINKL